VPLSGKRIFITGGAGFIGTTLARRLVDRNDVVALDNLHRDALSGTTLAEHPNFAFHQADVLDLGAVRELALGATHIVHCAAIAGVDTVRESPVRTMRVNVVGTYHALGAALETRKTLERFVDFSTSEVFGMHAFNVSEGQVSTIGSVGEFDGTLLCLERPEAIGQAFNIGNARSTVTILDLARRIKRLTTCPGELVFQPLPYADVELRIPNVQKARELLQFEAKFDLEEGLAKTIAWYRERTLESV
jgi:nucleoside-diphosphate-sugar epimerase